MYVYVYKERERERERPGAMARQRPRATTRTRTTRRIGPRPRRSARQSSMYGKHDLIALSFGKDPGKRTSLRFWEPWFGEYKVDIR